MLRTILTVLVLLLVLFTLWRTCQSSPTDSSIAKIATPALPGSQELPDGSFVWLDDSTHLVGAEQFNGQERRLQVVGQAFFELRAESGRPFIVETSELIIRANRGAFNVRDWPDETQVALTVLDGPIEATTVDSNEVFELQRGMVLKVDKLAYVINKKGDLTFNNIAWKRGTLQFRNQSIISVLTDLQAFYRRPLHLAEPSLRHCKFSDTFSITTPLEHIIDEMTPRYNMTVNRLGMNGFRIDGGYCE